MPVVDADKHTKHKTGENMSNKSIAVALLAISGLLLTGCSTTDPNAAPAPSASATAESPAGEGLDLFENPDALTYPGGMPRVVNPSTVTNLTIPEGFDQARAKEAYAWVASYAAFSFNESSFQNMKEMRQYALFAISPYFSANALPYMEDIFTQYADLNDYDDFVAASQSINNYGIVTVMPQSGVQGTYVNSPLFDQLKYGAATIEEYEANDEGLPVYKVSFPFSARLQMTDEGADKTVKNLEASRTFEIWVIDTGDESKPFLIETWTATTLDWRTTN